MKKVWQETVRVTGYTHKHVVDDYDGEPVVERQEREICVKATAWYCSESGTYRLDSMTVIRIKDSSSWIVGVWDGETVRRHIEKMMPRVHLAAVEPYVVLDSGAWPPGNPRRPPFEAWWQELGRWRKAPDDYGNLAYAIAYDTIGDETATDRAYAVTRERLFSRAPDRPIVPVMGFGQAPEPLAWDLEIGQGSQLLYSLALCSPS